MGIFSESRKPFCALETAEYLNLSRRRSSRRLRQKPRNHRQQRHHHEGQRPPKDQPRSAGDRWPPLRRRIDLRFGAPRSRWISARPGPFPPPGKIVAGRHRARLAIIEIQRRLPGRGLENQSRHRIKKTKLIQRNRRVVAVMRFKEQPPRGRRSASVRKKRRSCWTAVCVHRACPRL